MSRNGQWEMAWLNSLQQLILRTHCLCKLLLSHTFVTYFSYQQNMIENSKLHMQVGLAKHHTKYVGHEVTIVQ